MVSRIYTRVVTVGDVSIYQVPSDPSGVLTATMGSLAIQSGGASNPIIYQNTDGAMTWLSVDMVYSWAIEALRSRGEDEVNLLANLEQPSYPNVGAIPAGSLALEQYAVVNQPGPNSLVRQIAWSRIGEITWTATNWPYVKPPSPLGSWIINADDNSIGAGGNNAWQFYMGTELHITAAGNGLEMKRIAFKGGAASPGTTHNYDIRKSTFVGAAPPPLASYTTVVQAGTVTITAANDWEELMLGATVPLLQDEWYVIWFWVGVGGQFVGLPLLPSQVDLTYADQIAGVYRSAPGALPGPASSAPQVRQPSTLYGLATVGIG